ncbi:MAG: MATE family efflux transporter [Lachnospiraceae bacterium]|nr:hypothetical protein [Lachnospiraceae bacterium]MCI1424830.1 MATE family efflux transporter [Lachnospiraceae bacterium]
MKGPFFSRISLPFSLRLAANGLSECVDQVTVVFNKGALSLAGENGIAAVSIIMYLRFLVIGVYFGYSKGISPLLGFCLGRRDIPYCRALEKRSRSLLLVLPPLLYALTFLSAPVLAGFFAAEGSQVFHISVRGLRLYGLGFLFCGWNIFSAIRLTAYGQGHRAGLITSLRSFFLLLLFLWLLPRYLGLDGIWLSVPCAEVLTLPVSVFFLLRDQDRGQADRFLRDITAS